MIDELQYEGEWFLPDKPEHKVCGTLTFIQDEGARLKLLGEFAVSNGFYVSCANLDIILGVTSNGQRITLFDCIATNAVSISLGIPTPKFYAHWVFVGAHFDKKEDIKFKSLSISCSYLDEWVGISGFKMEPPEIGEFIVNVKYKRPDDIELTTFEGNKISVAFEATSPEYRYFQKEATISQKAYLQIEPPEEIYFKDYNRISYRLKNLLSLAAKNPAYTLTMKGETEANKEDSNGKTYYRPVSIYAQEIGTPLKSKPLEAFEMLFRLDDFNGRSEEFLNNWLNKAELLEPVYNLYFGSLYSQSTFIEERFLVLAQAVESYHRRAMNRFERSPERQEQRITGILDAVSSSELSDRVKKWLERKLKYSNEVSLKMRIEDIIKRYGAVLRIIIKDPTVFAQKVADTRNYRTHFSEDLRPKAAKGAEFVGINQKLKFTLDVCLLSELGFTLEEINNNLIKKNLNYQHEIGFE